MLLSVYLSIILTLCLSLSISCRGPTGKAETGAPDDPSKELEERVKVMAANLKNVMYAQSNHAQEINNLRDKLNKHEEESETERRGIKKKLHADRKEMHTRGLNASIMGLVVITIGIIMRTIPQEIHDFLF